MASIRLSGIAVGTTNLSVNVPAPCVATLPQDLGTNVGTDTDFTWTQMSGAIYMLSILGGATGGPSFYVFTAATSARIPDLAGQGLGLPPAAQYSWNVEAVGPWATIDEIAGPTSIVPPGNTEFEGMSAPRHFTTR